MLWREGGRLREGVVASGGGGGLLNFGEEDEEGLEWESGVRGFSGGSS